MIFLTNAEYSISDVLLIGLSFSQLNLTAGEEVEIDYEVDGWFYVSMQK